MKTIFKVNDKVYCYRFGWGKIISNDSCNNDPYPIFVQFKDSLEIFTKDGSFRENEPPSLSFTEYNLVTGGFSQERPLPNIKVDTLVYVRSGEFWSMRYFSHWEGSKIACFNNQKTSKTALDGETISWRNYSLTNPLEQ